MKVITIFLSLFILGCVTTHNYTQRTYDKIEEKPDETITSSYQVPVVKPAANTENIQEKGGVIISVEVLPFKVDRTVESERLAVAQDPTKPGYDRFEIKHTPHYNVEEGNIEFKFKIRNNEKSPLHLREIGFALIIDGTQWAFPEEQTAEWNKGMIMTGFEKEFIIQGPDMKSLNSSKIVYLFLNGVPTKYNAGGTEIVRKDNFEWYYECGMEEVIKEELVTYDYETSLFRKEMCASCKGTGKNPKANVCGRCEGHGKHLNLASKTVTCAKCSGTGKVYPECSPCSGHGQILYPESGPASIAKSVNWSGWNVKIVSIPAGATVSGCDPKTGDVIKSPRVTPYVGAWYRSAEQECPIILEYNGSTVSVMPVNPDGSPLTKIIVDFNGDTPKVVQGKDVTGE